MISFENAEVWDKFGHIYSNDDNRIHIDLRGCEVEEDYYKAFINKLNAPYSTIEGFGNNLDALADVVSDYYNENWLTWKEVYVTGWKSFINKHPVFSQEFLATLNSTYLTSIEGTLKLIEWGDISFEDAHLLDALTDLKPRMFLVLN